MSAYNVWWNEFCEGILVGILLMFQLLLHRSASSLVSVVEGNLLP